MTRKLSIFLLILLKTNINASETENVKDIDFEWALGTGKLSYVLINKANIEINALRFNWFLDEKYIIGFDVFSLGAVSNGISYTTVLPIELAYIPWTFKFNENNQLYFTVSNRIGLQKEYVGNIEGEVYKIEHKLFYSIGCQLLALYRKPHFAKEPYFYFASLYTDYNISHGLKFGMSINIPLSVWGILLYGFMSDFRGPGA